MFNSNPTSKPKHNPNPITGTCPYCGHPIKLSYTSRFASEHICTNPHCATTFPHPPRPKHATDIEVLATYKAIRASLISDGIASPSPKIILRLTHIQLGKTISPTFIIPD